MTDRPAGGEYGVADGRERGIAQRAHEDAVDRPPAGHTHVRVPEVLLIHGYRAAELDRPPGHTTPERAVQEPSAARAAVGRQVHPGRQPGGRADRRAGGMTPEEDPQERRPRVWTAGHADVRDGGRGPRFPGDPVLDPQPHLRSPLPGSREPPRSPRRARERLRTRPRGSGASPRRGPSERSPDRYGGAPGPPTIQAR